jgi:excisionase family DNA binding protein
MKKTKVSPKKELQLDCPIWQLTIQQFIDLNKQISKTNEKHFMRLENQLHQVLTQTGLTAQERQEAQGKQELKTKDIKCVVKEALLEALTETKTNTPKFYSRYEATKLLKISLPTLSRYIELGVINANRIGNRILISQEAIDEALRKM